MAFHSRCECGRTLEDPIKEGGYFICSGCSRILPLCNCSPLEKTTMQLPQLNKSFYISTGKTLKLEIRPGIGLSEAVEDARTYLESENCPHSRVEFKFGHCYIVVAKLRA